jgi:hypothetical protein
VLDQQLGVSVDEFNEKIRAGEISVNELIDALIAFSEQTYGGAAKDLSATLVGLQNRFTTIGMVILRDFTAPIMEKAVPALQVFVDALAADVQSGVFESIGRVFTSVMSSIVGDVEWTVESVATGIMEFMIWLAESANKMAKFGFGMMEAWGHGMLQGAFQAISAVANFISNAITSLFSTHSPPKILPLIDVWGAETIEAWLEGMTNADFSILNDIVGTISSILQNVGLEEGSIQGVMQRLVKAVSGGGISSALGVLGSVASPFSGQLGDIIGVYRELAKENEVLEGIMNKLAGAEARLAKQMGILEVRTKAVEQAQRDLKDAMQFYEDSDEAVQRLVREYNALLRAGADEDVLKIKQNEIDAMMEQRTEAAKMIKDAEKQVDIAEDAKDKQQDIVDEHRSIVDRIEEERKAQQIVIDQIEERLAKEKAVLDLMIKLTKKIEESKEKLGKMKDTLGDMQGIIAGVGDDWDFDFELDEQLNNLLEGLKEDLEIQLWILYMQFDRWWNSVEEIFTGEDTPFAIMVKDVGDLITLIGNIQGIGEDVINSWELFKLKVELVWQNAKLVWLWLDLIKTWVKTPWDLVAIGNLATEINTLEGEIGNTKTSIDVLEDRINDQTNSTFPKLGDALHTVTGDFEDTEESVDNVSRATGSLKTTVNQFKAQWRAAWQSAERELENKKTPIIDYLGNIEGAFGGIAGFISGMLSDLRTFLTMIKNAVIPDWMMRESPSPIEMTLMGMREHLKSLAHTELPAFTTRLNLMSNANDLVNFQPTPTGSISPSAASATNVTNNNYFGGNTVRDDTDLALMENAMIRNLRQASYGA